MIVENERRMRAYIAAGFGTGESIKVTKQCTWQLSAGGCAL